VDAEALDYNLRTMAAARPGASLRPHVKAHKCTALARRQAELGHRGFTCATIREMEGLAAAGLAEDLLLANEVVDARRLGRVEGRVTRRRDEIGQLARDFDAMAGRIEGLVESQRRLLRDVSHELRSPLARLVVALELARTRAGESAAGALDRIGREAARLEELISHLLLLERLEAGTAEGDEVEVDLAALVAEVASDAAFEAAADGVEVRFGGGGDGRVRGRPDLLRSAFENVVRNAVRHTGPGTAVDVELRADDGGATVTVPVPRG